MASAVPTDASGRLPSSSWSFSSPPPLSEADREANDAVMKRVAKIFLGNGCDRTASPGPNGLRIRSKILENFSDEMIGIRHPFSLFKAVVRDNAASAIEVLTSYWKMGLGIEGTSYVPVGSSVSMVESTESRAETKTDQAVFVVCRLVGAECYLDQLPPLKQNLPSDPAKIGDAVIRSGLVYARYELTFTIDFDSRRKLASKKKSGEASMPIERLGMLGISKEDIDQKFKGRKISGISGELRGFDYPYSFSAHSLEDICKEVERVERIFFEHLPKTKSRQAYVRATDVIDKPVSITHLTNSTMDEAKSSFPAEGASGPVEPVASIVHRTKQAIDEENSFPAVVESGILPNWARPSVFGEVAEPGKRPSLLQGANGTSKSSTSLARPSISSTEDSSTRFYKLADRMLASFSIEYQVALGKDLRRQPTELRTFIGSMFRAIEEIFFGACKIISTGHFAPFYTEVIGESGMGKSLLVGYLLNKEIVRTTIDVEGVLLQVLDFLDYNSARDRPTVGHGSSQTKGGEVYGKYIDTGGLLDSGGEEADVCNAIAISMITRTLCPNRLIVVLPPGCFDGRAQGFIGMIEKLKRCVHNLTHPTTLASILFLINDKEASIDQRPPITEERIRQKIAQAIMVLKGERKKLLPESKRTIFDRFQERLEGFARAAEDIPPEGMTELADIDPSLAQKVMDLQKSIDIMELLLKRSNIAVVNFFSSVTREKVDSWQADESTGHLMGDDFTMENLVEGGYGIFKTVLTIAATYFNGLFNEKQALNKLIGEQASDIKTIRDVITRLQDDVNAESPVDRYKREKREYEIALEKLKAQLEELEEDKASKVKRLQELKSDSPIFLEDLKPDRPIEPRSWLAWLPVWTTTYKFEYSGIPIHHVEKVEPTKNRKYPGCYIAENTKKLAEGKYSVSYQAGWCNYPEDSRAVVKIYVEIKNHPSAQAEIDNITAALTSPDTGLNDQINNLSKKIEEYKKQSRELKELIKEEGQRLEQQRELDRKILQEKIEELEKLEKKQADNFTKKTTIASELDSFKAFCELVAQVIKSRLGFLTSKNESEQRIFAKFCENVHQANQ